MRVHLHSRPLGTQYTSIGEKRQEKCAKPRWLPAVKRRGDKLALIFVVVILLALPRETNSFVATRAQFVVVLLAIGPADVPAHYCHAIQPEALALNVTPKIAPVNRTGEASCKQAGTTGETSDTRVETDLASQVRTCTILRFGHPEECVFLLWACVEQRH